MSDNKNLAASSLGLFTSLGTLVCCALPALFVTLGAGAALAGLVSAVPQLIWLSENKALVFGLSGALMLLAAVMAYRGRHAPCPADPAQATACRRLRRVNVYVLAGSAAIWATGFFFAFIAPRVFA